MSELVLRVGYVPGVTPDKWARSWRERRDGIRLELSALDEGEAEAAVRAGRVDMVLARLPIDRTGLHLVRLYEEVTVVVVAREHPVAAYDEIDLTDLTGEQFIGGPPGELVPDRAQLGLPPLSALDALDAVDAVDAVDAAASGVGVVILPQSVARLHHRRDAVHRPVRGLPPTTIGLVWPIDRDDAVTQAFVGVVRGRTPRSSRG